MTTKEVTITKVPGTPTTVVLNGGNETVQDVLDVDGVDITVGDGEQVQVNGERASLDSEVEDGDTITVSGKISGSR